ncbi:CoA pyrophosphatase [Massilia cavernae]|uniref:CoA pyrophosphatase n=1 Tax=Massilia cavernae TaxID=2320864 RepID=A0A418Y4E7_9BURK|nr:CoA pyrophosphatase [Massilia cavernae]RJG20587.1 CoA pyrophosphatase [Massilia cavernae]
MSAAKPLFDPQSLPVDAIAGESALGHERMVAEWLRQRFANPPTWEPEASEMAWLARPKITAASVLIPLVQRPEGLSLLLTQRTDHLSSHAGQISFPGGRAEEGDASAIDTALRETEEEIGLGRSHIDILGALPDYVTGSGYRVTPVVGLVTPPFELAPDPNEVADVFEVPLPFLMDGMNHQRLSVELPEGAGRRHFYAMAYGRHFIWGATAGMLRNLFHLLRA